MCALSDEEVGLRKEYYKKIRSEKYSRAKRIRSHNSSIPDINEDPSVSILVKSSNLEKLKNLHWYYSDNRTVTYDDLLNNLFDLVNEVTGKKGKY